MTYVHQEIGVGALRGLSQGTSALAAELFAPRTDDLFGEPALNVVPSLGGWVVAGVSRRYPQTETFGKSLRSDLRAAWVGEDGALQIEVHSEPTDNAGPCRDNCLSCVFRQYQDPATEYRGAAMPDLNQRAADADMYALGHLKTVRSMRADCDLFVPDGYNFEAWATLFSGHHLSEGLRTAIAAERASRQTT